MDLSKKEILVVYLDKAKIYFYSESLGSALQLEIPLDIESDLDIVKRDKFQLLFDGFIKNNLKGVAYNVILVYSQNITFDKDIVPVLGKEIEDQIQEFVSIVPFEEVLSRSYKLGKNTKVVAANNVFYEILNTVFERNKSGISMALPYSVLQQIYPELANQIDFATIVQKATSLKQYNLIGRVKEEPLARNKKGKKKLNTKMISLVGVFIVLLLIMFVFGYMTFFQNDNENAEEFIEAFTPTPKIQNEIVNSPTPIDIIPIESTISAAPVTSP